MQVLYFTWQVLHRGAWERKILSVREKARSCHMYKSRSMAKAWNSLIPAQEDLIVLYKFCCVFPSLKMCFSWFSLSVSIIVYHVRVWRRHVTCLLISRWSIHEGPFPDLMKYIIQFPNTLSFEWDITTGRIVVVSIRNRVWVVYM